MNIYEEICQRAEALQDFMKVRRQDFHTYAETGWFEIRTTSILVDELKKMGYKVLYGKDIFDPEARMGVPDQGELDRQYERAVSQGAIQPYAQAAKDGFTGAVAILECGDGPVIGMRFDIDALGVFEESAPTHRPAAEGFRSVNEGMMHACGHDGHAAIGLGVARVLMDMKDRLHGTVKLVFQPAEEGLRGARGIAGSGLLDDVDYMLANHMGARGAGEEQVGLTGGKSLASTKLDAYFSGTAAHAGAVPEKGCNAMLAAATAVLNLYAMPRHSEGGTRINVGTLQAGSGRNVICDRAKLEIEVRGATTEISDYLFDYARRIIESAAQMHGCSSEIKVMGAASSMWSDEELMERTMAVCREKLGLNVRPPREQGMGGSEDCAYLFDRVREHGGKAVFFNTLTPYPGPGHSTIFDIREEDLPNGVKVFCGLACDLMGL